MSAGVVTPKRGRKVAKPPPPDPPLSRRVHNAPIRERCKLARAQLRRLLDDAQSSRVDLLENAEEILEAAQSLHLLEQIIEEALA